MSTCRPSRMDGLAKTRNLFSNCNVLNAKNTNNLEFNVDKILPEHSI